MKNGKLDANKYLRNSSSRHHYIPQFFINAFANSDGLLYVYDKQKDQILKRPRPPKAIFFENNRNTLELDDETSTSIIEDFLYKEIDDKTSCLIRQYQKKDITSINFTTDDSATFLFFLISLFWRIPKTDYAAGNLMDSASIISEGGDPDGLKTDPTYRKLRRAGLFKHHIDEIRAMGLKGTKWINIHQSSNPVYVIGDYPILFRKHSGKFSEFNDTDILVAVSSRRIYSSTNQKISTISTQNAWRYNACIISQSVRYIACGSFETLEFSVLFYKKLKETGLIWLFPEAAFKDL